MANYLDVQKEETLKAHVFRDYFDKTKFAYDPNIGNIDFIVTSAFFSIIIHYLWAEAKKGEADEVSMLTQLILTCKKTYDSGEYLPPLFIGCFDAVKIVFVPFHNILPIFAENDINWNLTPSNYLSDNFIKIRKKVAKLIIKNIVVFSFDEDAAEIKSFIKTNFIPGIASAKSPITKNNFPHIYNRWIKEVKPTIHISAERWQKYKKEGILDCDFFRADMMSKEGTTIIEGFNIILEKDKYKLQKDFGENWQEEYYVWDCAAGTGNLLAGLVHKYHVWASTIDQPDVDAMHALIDEGFNVLHEHVFPFDFLNDSFGKLPEGLKKIIEDKEKWKYYHAEIKGNNTVSVNALFYDIREFFQGRKENGKMNLTSADETYNMLIKNLRKELKTLSQKIEPKVYEYGFLKE